MDHGFPPLLTRISRTVRMWGREDTGLESMTLKAEIPHLLKKTHKGCFGCFCRAEHKMKPKWPCGGALTFCCSGLRTWFWEALRPQQEGSVHARHLEACLGSPGTNFSLNFIYLFHFVFKSVSKLRLALHLLDFTTAWYITFSFPLLW